MKIEILEDRIETITDNNYISIIELIINAVRDYPLYGLNDTSEYFNEIKMRLGTEEINVDSLKKYLELNPEQGNEDNIWITSSLNSLLESFELMNLYKISFDQILTKIESLK